MGRGREHRVQYDAKLYYKANYAENMHEPRKYGREADVPTKEEPGDEVNAIKMDDDFEYFLLDSACYHSYTRCKAHNQTRHRTKVQLPNGSTKYSGARGSLNMKKK